MKRSSTLVFSLLFLLTLSAVAEAGVARPLTQFGLPALSRADFNRLAVANELPLFWQSDRSRPGTVEPGELIPLGTGRSLAPFVENGRFTEDFRTAYRILVEARRREAVAAELDQGRPTVVASDFRRAPTGKRDFVRHIVRAGAIIDELYQEQNGALRYRSKIPAADPMSVALYERNMGPWCAAPKTQNDPFCNAVATFPKKHSDAYPEGMAQDAAMCRKLSKGRNGKALMNPFTVVRRHGGKLVALPLTEVYGERMRSVAAELRAAAELLPKKEEALRSYLLAAAGGFETNDWDAADEAWAAMNSRNSAWYLRIGPDETYFDPCQEKAGFHVSFATIDRTSLAWQDRLNPLRQEMEDTLAALIGETYAPRAVAFQFPDFIEMVLNSGDSRHNLGATVGQSLPNWGPVAEEGRRRTVVMTNLYTDPDSKRIVREKARLLLDPASMRYFTDDREPSLIGIILHEATHNFGPHSDYRIDGKGPSEIFGGRTATTLEELKAQTGALWYVDYLRRKGLISERRAREIYTDEIDWCFNHIARGMFTASGNPKAYSQLAAIQIGSFMRDGALSWDFSVDEGTGETIDRFRIHYDKLPAAIEKLMQRTGRILATGDAKGARSLIDDYITGPGSKLVHMREIQDRLLRFSKASFYYTVQL